MTRPVKHFYEFGPFRIDVANRLLLRDGEPVGLTIKAFDTLLALVERSGQVVEKDELMRKVWPDTVVEENNLTQNISALRKIIGEDASGRRYIETLPRRGYRFCGAVSEVAEGGAEIIVQKQTRSHVVVQEQREVINEEAPALSAPSSRRLKWSTVTVCALAVAVAVGAYLWSSGGPGQKSLAVLPFRPLSADAGDKYLELGMADALITKLSNINRLIVRPTNSIIKYADAPSDPVATGRELGVESVLDGSVQRVGEQVRVTVRLLRVSDGAPVWADTFDESFTNIFALQDSISRRIAAALALRMTGEERKLLKKRYTENTDAYQAYLKGRYYLFKWNGPALQKAIEYFGQAIEKDSGYALAYSGLADSYNLLGYLNIWPPKEAFPKSEEAARRALAMDDALGEAHLSIAKVRLFYDWDARGFESEIKRSLDHNPNYQDAHSMYGTYLTAIGRFEEAAQARKRAQELDPLSPFFTNSVGWPYFYARDYDRAIEWYRKALELDPNFAQAHSDISICYHKKGMYAESVEETLTARSISGAKPEALAALRQAFAAAGMKGFWQKELEMEVEHAKQAPADPHRMARIYTELGDKDRAFEWFEKALEARHSLMVFLSVNPLFDSLHSDPRFANLIGRIGLSR